MSRRLRLAVLLSFVCQGVLILTGRYRLSYDAFTHMLLADHYRLDWWSLWDTRWYTGFTLTSYPPLVHQVMGLIGHLIGVDAAFALVLWAVLTAFPLAIYAFSRVFMGQRASETAALGVVFLPSIYLTAHVFGQLPTLVAALLALLSAAALARFLRYGGWLNGLLAVVSAASVVAAHHATVLLMPPLAAAVIFHLLLNRRVSLADLVRRLAVYGPLVLAACGLVIWPFWQWSLAQTMQVPIDHLSRHNFFTDHLAALVFFWPVYGPLVVLIPWLWWKVRNRRFIALAAVFTLLFVLGLGGTTPLPRWLFGSGWAWLTYDRFAFWASLFLMPVFGAVMTGVRFKIRRGRWGWARKWALPVASAPLAVVALITSLFPTLLPTEPRPLDMQPIVQFLAQEDPSQWRYITLGFGDQFAYLNRLTTATTIDGSYHTARTLPELRSSGLGQIDTAYWQPDGLQLVEPVLQKSGQYGVRWAFVNHPAYVPLLVKLGWVQVETLSNHVQVWENPTAVLPSPVTPPPASPLTVISWGTFPMLALGLTLLLGGITLWPVRARKVFLEVHGFAVGLLPLGLVLWYFLPVTDIHYDRVYFTYDNALLFVSDALALLAVLAWAMARLTPESREAPVRKSRLKLTTLLASFDFWLLALLVWITLSVTWSMDWRISLYFSLHCWLVYLLYLSLRDQPRAWRLAALGLAAALGLETLIGFWQFAVQSTAFLKPLMLNWPGPLDPSVQGASVVQLSDQTRWLRVYGTLPHPNILGGLLILMLAGPAALFLDRKKPGLFSMLLFTLGIALLILTFSRAAWIGGAVVAGLVILNFRQFNAVRLRVMALAGVGSFAVSFYSLRSLIFTRLGGVSVATETFSSQARVWLAGQALEFIRLHPLLGSGAGTFILELSRLAPPGYIIEPVHNIPLLVQSELGPLGSLILLGLGLTFLWACWRVKQPAAILLAAAVMGLAVVGLFDHAIWTLAPERMELGLALGLWAGQRRLNAG